MPTVEPDSARVWDLLTEDFTMEVPGNNPVKVYGVSPGDPVRLRDFQIFEAAMAVALEKAHPDYDWRVTAKGGDRGLDFIGEQYFFDETKFGIDAAIKVGGQCKKRSTVDTVVKQIAADLVEMGDEYNPTFFVFALSADVTARRIKIARGKLERQLNRHCHILDRPQVEMLLGDHISEVKRVLDKGLEPDQVDYVVSYLTRRKGGARVRVMPEPIHSVLAGVPFKLDLLAHGVGVADPSTRFRWRARTESDARYVRLLSPLGAETPRGALLAEATTSDDPLHARVTLELETFSVGRVRLGEVVVDGDPDPTDLGDVDVVENVRPPFYERPVGPALTRLRQTYDRVAAGAVASRVIVGAGGSGKSRLCEEFSREKRRLGCHVISAKHAQTPNEPHQLLRELFVGLAADAPTLGSPGDTVVNAIAGYDAGLAERAAPAIRALFPSSQREPISRKSEDAMVAALDLLITLRVRRAPLIVHLQDLHWASADVLLLLDRLLLELRQIVATLRPIAGRRRNGILFLFEGREQEDLPGPGEHSAKAFETFVWSHRKDRIRCAPFGESDRRAFVRHLFENRISTDRRLPEALVERQDDLIEYIDARAGGNPFHSVEQVQLLKEREVIGQNPHTGLVYMIRPIPEGLKIPEEVLELIQLRWRYLKEHAREVALLVWGCALLEARVPAPLYRALKNALAPDAEQRDIEGTDIVWTGGTPGRDLVFRHENYFEAFHREFHVSDDDLGCIVDVYCRWFESLRRPSPGARFSWARALLKGPAPDTSRALSLLRDALRGARRQGDQRLARRIAVYRLDEIWKLHDREALPVGTFLRRCDDEVELSRELLSSDRDQAGPRMRALIERIEARLARTDRATNRSRGELERRRLAAEVVYDAYLFNAGDPRHAAELAARTVAAIRSERRAFPAQEADWDDLEMEALYCQSCALDLSGDAVGALASSEQAAAVARRSTSPLARKIVSTHANILLINDAAAGEALLRDLLPLHDHTSDAYLVMVHLTRALVRRAYLLDPDDEQRVALLDDARERAEEAFHGCEQIGLHPDTAAAALMRGIVAALANEGTEDSWFAQAVDSATRGRQMETLWRSHINLATALYRREGRVTDAVRDHAASALQIMSDSLPSSEPDRSPRFDLLRAPMVQAVRFLLGAGDEMGTRALERYSALRPAFRDVATGELAEGEPHVGRNEWIRLGTEHYVLY